MRTTSLNPRTVVPWLGAMLACSILVTGVRPAAAQFSPSARQALVAMLNGAPPYERQLILNAIRALGPERAEMELRQFSLTPPAAREAVGQLVTRILQGLPQQYHQMFIDGLFDVSPQETQFVAQVAEYINSQVASDRSATDMINRYRDHMLGIQQGAFERRDAFLGQQAEGMGGALGASTQFYDPNSGRQLEGYTAPSGMQTYLCPESNVLVSHNGLPHVGCVQVYTR